MKTLLAATAILVAMTGASFARNSVLYSGNYGPAVINDLGSASFKRAAHETMHPGLRVAIATKSGNHAMSASENVSPDVTNFEIRSGL